MVLHTEQFKVFISHATNADGKLVEWMAEALDRIHIRAYVYERYPRGGQNRFETIKNMIKWCPYFLVVLTKDGITSQWVNQEIGYAVAALKEVIPIQEVDSDTGQRIESRGFVELHDPILYYRGQEERLMAEVIYTFYQIMYPKDEWKDLMILSCRCGNEFEGRLEFFKNWERWRTFEKEKQTAIWWQCKKCSRRVRISFPDCHLLPQRR